MAESTRAAALARMADGYLITQVLYVAGKLGIADLLARGPLTAEALASAVGAQPGPLRRILRALAAEGVLDEGVDGTFGLTELGEQLRSDVLDSQLGAILARGGLYFAAAGGLLDAVQHGGGPAFEHVHGRGLFDYLREHSELGAVFQASMANRASREADAVVGAFDFNRFDRVVDVGGGAGVLLEAIVGSTQRTRGVLFDMPAVVDRTRLRLSERATAAVERIAFVGGDFFETVPAGADCYVMSRVIHDWDDDAAVRIMRACRAAMPAAATLLLVEAILPERAIDQPAAIRMDLHMLELLPGRERTAVEFERLLNAADLDLVRLTPPPPTSAADVAILEAAPRS